MTGPNNTNSGDERVEANDNIAEANANKRSKIIRSYIWKKLTDKSQRLAFAKKIKKLDTTPNEVIQEIQQLKDANPEFAGIDITKDTIAIVDIKRELWGYLSGISSKITTLRSIFLQEYDISSQDYTKYILWPLQDISSEQELQDLLDADTSRDTFLATIYKKNKPKRKLVSNILQELDIEKRFEWLPPHEQQEFSSVIHKFKTRQSIEVYDIMALFESSILTIQEKQRIIETFMPIISVEDALQLWIIDQKWVIDFKKKALESSIDVGVFSGVDVENYIGSIDNKDMILSTQWLFASAKQQEKLFEQNFFFQKFKQDFDAMLKKIEEDLAKQSIQTVWEMQEILSSVNHVSGIEKFKPGSTIVVKQKQKDASGNTKVITLFAEVVSLASAGTFMLKDRGIDTYDNRSTTAKVERNTYSEFIDYVTKDNIPESVEVLSPEELQHKIKMGEIQDENMNGEFEDRQEISSEIQDLTKKIEERKTELRKQKIPKSQWDKDEELQKLYTTRDEKNTLRDNVEENNLQVLRNKINEVDIPGKEFGLENGTSFVTQAWKGDIFSILDVDEMSQLITVKWLQDEETLSYAEFFRNFSEQKATRVSQVHTFSELFTKTDDAYKSWSDFELKSWKIRNKNTKQKIDYDYLVPDKGASTQELLKIHSIDDTMVTVSFWEAKSNNTKDTKGDKKEGEVFSVEKNTYTMSIGVLDYYIRENGLSFRSLKEWKVAEEEKQGIPKPESKFGFGNWFFQWMSMMTLIKSWKIGVEQITNILNEWDEEKANQFTLKVLGPLLGKDGKTDLMSRVEQTQKKNMDEMIDRLKWINSYPATKLIESWMLDPRVPQYKKEAGMFYMFEKYGALCAKQLYKYQGQYFWYQKMGWRIGDSNWVEVHEANNRDPQQNTTEEELVYKLMKKQTGTWGYNGIQRRSKLDKELKALRGKGKEEEYDTGKKDGGNERDIKDRLDGALSEMSSGNYPNAFGWLETITDKWGTMEQMNMVPFVMMFSWMAYNFEKDILDKVKSFPWQSRMLMMLRMMSYKSDIDLVNNTIMEACSRLETRGYSGIEKKARSIFDNRYSRSSESQKQKKTIEFYKEYGEVLTNVLYMLNTGKEEDIHNKMIFFEKDDTPVFSQYYDKMQWYLNADCDFGKDEWLMSDAFAEAGTSGLDVYRATKQVLELRTWWAWAKHDAGPYMWREIRNEFEAIPKRKYDPDPVKNEKMQRKLLESNLRKFLSAIVSLNTDTRTTSSYNAPTWFFSRLNDWGVYFDDVINAGANADAIKWWEHWDLIDKFVDGIMNYSLKWISSERPTKSDGKWWYEYIKENETTRDTNTISVSDLIQWKTQKIVDRPPATNDNDFSEQIRESA